MMKRPKGKHAWTVTVGTKGQIVIAIPPKDSFNSLMAKVFPATEDSQ